MVSLGHSRPVLGSAPVRAGVKPVMTLQVAVVESVPPSSLFVPINSPFLVCSLPEILRQWAAVRGSQGTIFLEPATPQATARCQSAGGVSSKCESAESP